MSIPIPLANRPNVFTLVSDEDAARVQPYRWYRSQNGYVVTRTRCDGQRILLYLHRLILQAQPGQLVDHVNHDPLDNTRTNLRLVTPQQNVRNRRVPCNSTTGLIGVSVAGNQYQARLRVNGRSIYLGTHAEAETAALVRDAYARRVDADHFTLNYPERPTPPAIAARLDQILSGVKLPRARKPKPPSLGRSSYRGVSSDRGRWRVKIGVQRQDIHIGYFDDEVAAAQAYDAAARQYHGSRARLNFPPSPTSHKLNNG